MFTTATRHWISLAQGAKHIGVSERTLRRMIASGEIPGYRFGNRLVRVDQDQLDKIMRPIPTATGGDAG